VLSSLCNSGLSLNQTPDNLVLLFLLLAMIGGSIISNTSGIKFMRVYILIKTTSSEILKLIRPNNITNLNILNSEKKINSENIRLSFLIFISFFISLFILSSVLILDEISFDNSFKLSILTLTNTTNSDLYGLSNVDFSNLLTKSKISIIIFMIVGKIELISVFLIIKNFFFKN
jgi:trk system potassium uptake protein TrkH